MSFWGVITEVKEVAPNRWALHIQGKSNPEYKIEANDSWCGYDSSTFKFYKTTEFYQVVESRPWNDMLESNRFKPKLWDKLINYTTRINPAFVQHLPQDLQSVAQKAVPPLKAKASSVWDHITESDTNMTPVDYYIWWLTEEERDVLEKSNQYTHLPSILVEQLRSAFGRNGRGRLWDGFKSEVSVDPWPSTPMAEHCSTCAGIVIRSEHRHCLKDLPGTVTDLRLRRAY